MFLNTYWLHIDKYIIWKFHPLEHMITSVWLEYYILFSAQTPKVIQQIFESVVYCLQCKQTFSWLKVLRQQFRRGVVEWNEKKKKKKKEEKEKKKRKKKPSFISGR